MLFRQVGWVCQEINRPTMWRQTCGARWRVALAASSVRVYRHEGKTNAKVGPGECLGNKKHGCIDWQPSVDEREKLSQLERYSSARWRI